jgi:hypothetical protein
VSSFGDAEGVVGIEIKSRDSNSGIKMPFDDIRQRMHACRALAHWPVGRWDWDLLALNEMDFLLLPTAH